MLVTCAQSLTLFFSFSLSFLSAHANLDANDLPGESPAHPAKIVDLTGRDDREGVCIFVFIHLQSFFCCKVRKDFAEPSAIFLPACLHGD